MSGPETPAEMARAVKTLGQLVRRQIAADEKVLRALPSRPLYDYRALSRQVRAKVDERGIGYRAVADEIGVTASDLSRIGASRGIVFEKVVAICDWLGIDDRALYTPPPKKSVAKSNCCSAAHVKHSSVSRADRSPEATGPATARRTVRPSERAETVGSAPSGPQSRPAGAKSRKAKP